MMDPNDTHAEKWTNETVIFMNCKQLWLCFSIKDTSLSKMTLTMSGIQWDKLEAEYRISH